MTRHYEGSIAAVASSPGPRRRAERLRVKRSTDGAALGAVLPGLFFLSVCGVLLNERFGFPAVLLFLAPWGVILALRHRAFLDGLRADYPLLVLPTLALLSALWSDDPLWSVRAAVQFAITIGIGLAAVHCIGFRDSIKAMLLALTVIAALSVVDGTTQISGITGEPVLVGLFGSKNSYSFVMALMMVIGLAVALDGGYGRLLRLLGLGGVLASPFLLYAGKSLGAMILTLAALAAMAAYVLTRRWSAQKRLTVAFLALSAVALPMLVYFIAGYSVVDILDALGKDSGMTGRGYLWSRATDFIAENPLMGVGYQAFWRQGNPGAEELWQVNFIGGRSGFNFHNTYFEVGVDLGLLGVVCFSGLMATFGLRAVKRLFEPYSAAGLFTVGAVFLLLPRTFVEVVFVDQFRLATLVFCMAWVVARQSAPPPPPPAASRLAVSREMRGPR
jgi:exopolysaccharide production protein ExoQ